VLQRTAATATINVSGVSHSLRHLFQILNRLLGFAETFDGRSWLKIYSLRYLAGAIILVEGLVYL
jgi:hypothetical protein